MRVVLDTNVLVSAILSPQGPCGQLVSLVLRGDLQLVTSRTLLVEAEETVAEVIAPEAAATIAGVLRDMAELVVVEAAPPTARDPDDDWVVATAAAGGVEYVVTGDYDLLALNRGSGDIAFIEPTRMLQILAFLGEEPG